MKDERNHIDHLFRAALDNHTEVPPPDVWAALEQRLPVEKRRRRWGWLWGSLILLALLGGTAAVYSVLKNDRPETSAGRALAGGNQPANDKPGSEAPGNEDLNETTEPTRNPATEPPPENNNNSNTAATTGPAAPAGSPRAGGSTARSTQGSAALRRNRTRRSGQAIANGQRTGDQPNPTAGTAQPGGASSNAGSARRTRTAVNSSASSNRAGSDGPNPVAGSNPARSRRSTAPSNRRRQTVPAQPGNAVAGAPGNLTPQPPVALGGTPTRRGRTGNNTGSSRRPATSNTSVTNPRPNGAGPGATPAPDATANAASARPARRSGSNDVANNGSRRTTRPGGANNRQQPVSAAAQPADGAPLASGSTANAARRPRANSGATAGRPKRPARTTNATAGRKPDEGIVVPPSDVRRNADEPGQPARRPGTIALRDDPAINPTVNPAQPTAASPLPANPEPQAGKKPGGRFSDDDPRGDKGLLMSEYLGKAGAAASTGANDAGDQRSDDAKTTAGNSGGGGGGGGAGPSNPKARPAPRGRWEGGVKMGYEVGAGSNAINKAVMGPYVQYNISDRAAVVLQPAYKSGQFKGGGKTTTDAYLNVLAPPTVTTTMTLVDSIGGGGIDSLYSQVVSQSYDSILVSRKIDNQSFWEVELPLLFSYQLSKMFSFFAGPVLSLNRQFTQSSTQQTITVQRSQVFDSLQAPLPAESYTNQFTTGQPAFSTYKPAAASEITTGMGIGYMAGLQARFGIISADLTVQQRISGLPEKARAPEVRSALSAPYIRLSLGVRLFGNGKKKPTDRDMVNEQPYQRME